MGTATDRNYYDLLEVPVHTSRDAIAEAIKTKKRTWIYRQNNAPRRDQQDEARDLLELVPKIEDTLLDPHKRAQYDRVVMGGATDRNYYDLLEVPVHASRDEIAAAIKTKTRIWLQRQNAPRREQQEEALRLLELVPQMEFHLLDPQRRQQYDLGLKEARAQYNLGVMYEEGHGVPQNFETAVFWYRKAAKQGNADAQAALRRLGYR